MIWSVSTSAPKLLASILVLGSAGLATAAGFEGVIESRMKMSGQAEGGTSRTFVSQAGMRQEVTFGKKGEAVTMVTLILRSKPGLAFMVNDDKKTYAELDLASMKGAAAEKSPEKYTVTRLGNEKVAGYDCAHGKVQSSKGDHWEVWATREISGAEDFWSSLSSEQKDQGGARLYKAMKDAGLDGWPVKMVVQGKGSGEGPMTWEATRIERKALASHLFSLAGYKKSESGPMGAMGQMKLSPAQQKELDDALKGLSPEQRKQMEEMMKGMQGGQKP
jgi:hypothetical protein